MRLLLAVVLIAVVYGLFAWYWNQPQQAGADVPDGKFQSLSFAPFREGQSPLRQVFPSEQQIDEDLHLMARISHSIRTYASGLGLRPVPRLAARHGLTVTQGAWIGVIDADNDKEVNALIDAANTYPDVIKQVIVGNEVLLRGEMPPEKLLTYIRKVKNAIKQPVSYADVWSMYMKYPQLIREVDYITIHILPYWEDEPVAVDEAISHIEQVYRTVRREADGIAPGKPILIGESGWPGFGRQRGYAVPGVVNAAHFTRGLIRTAIDNGFDYNIVEAFNQPWKSALEGTVGANWGLYDRHRRQVYPLTGPVAENPDWLRDMAATLLLLVSAVVVLRGKLQALSTSGLYRVLLMQLIVSAMLVNTATTLWYSSYNGAQYMQTLLVLLLQVWMAVLLILRAIDITGSRGQASSDSDSLYLLYTITVLVAIYKTFWLASWGRYLDFPSEILSIPIAGLIGLSLIQLARNGYWSRRIFDLRFLTGDGGRQGRLDSLWAGLLILMAIVMIAGETRAFMLGRDMLQAYPDFYQRLQHSLAFTLGNGQLIVWVFCLLLLGFYYQNSVFNRHSIKDHQDKDSGNPV